MLNNTIKNFWNSNKIVSEFKDAQVQSYWVEFFASIENKDKKIVLDFGCGGGRYTEMLAKMGFRTYAFDLHQGMVNEIQARMDKIDKLELTPKIVQAKMTNITFESQLFDIVLSN